MLSRKEKLERLGDLVVDKYIDWLERGDVHPRDMASIVSLLNQNSIVEEKTQSSLEEDIKKRVREAEERRSANNS